MKCIPYSVLIYLSFLYVQQEIHNSTSTVIDIIRGHLTNTTQQQQITQQLDKDKELEEKADGELLIALQQIKEAVQDLQNVKLMKSPACK